MVDVDHVVVGLELGERREELRRARAAAAADLAALAEDLGLGDERQRVGRQPDAAREPADERQRLPSRRRDRLGERIRARRRVDVVAGEQLAGPRPLGGPARHDDEPRALLLPAGELRRDRGERAAGGARVAECETLGRVRGHGERGVVEDVDSFRLDAATSAEHLAPFGRGQVEALGRRVKPALARGIGCMRLHLDPSRLGRGLDLRGGLQPDDGISGQVVRHPGELGIEVGKQELGAGQQQSGTHALDELATLPSREPELRGTVVDRAGGVGAETRAPELGDRQEEQLLDRAERPLRRRVESAEALDGVTQEFQPGRLAIADREDVEDAAAQREVARVLDERHAVIPPLDEARDERVRRDRLAGDHVRDRGGELGPRQAAEPPRLGRGHDDGREGVHQVVEALRACRDRLPRRRERLEGRHLPSRDVVHPPGERRGRRLVAQEKPEVARKGLGLRRRCRDDDRGPLASGEELCEAERRSATAQPGDPDRRGPLDGALQARDDVAQRGRHGSGRGDTRRGARRGIHSGALRDGQGRAPRRSSGSHGDRRDACTGAPPPRWPAGARRRARVPRASPR